MLFNGSALGIRMRNGQTSEDGNDAAFDNIEVLDAASQLDKSFSPNVLNVDETSLLTFTITNTDELAAKEGWSFKDTLPAGLVVASPAAASSTCAAPTTVTATAGGSTIAVKGSLAAETNYCTVNVNVTSATGGTYTNGPADISEEVGIDPPGPASVQFEENADLQDAQHTRQRGTRDFMALRALTKLPHDRVVASDLHRYGDWQSIFDPTLRSVDQRDLKLLW